MRKTFAITICTACLVTLIIANFAVGSRLSKRVADARLINSNEAAQSNLFDTNDVSTSDSNIIPSSELNAADDSAQDWRPAQEGAEPIRYQPFEVEVLVGGARLEQYPARGRVYVEARAGAEYELRVRNPLPVRVAVALAVDGLNSIDARRTTARDASKWIIEPYGTIAVTGWQMSRTRARRFYFTSERDSYANKIGRAEDVGIISAVFFRERRVYSEVAPPSPRPLDSQSQRGEGELKRESESAPSTSASGARQPKERAATRTDDDEYAATGIGRSIGNDVRWVNLDLEREPAADVTIRYEYRPALISLGILPRPVVIDPDPLRRRERARGFKDPRYCPQP
ncbi:MAG: hypothetical protein QOE33_2873 [Acidobacteriota bacterium]|nr:hypothetical protein [Acidobacteriota bacterium]